MQAIMQIEMHEIDRLLIILIQNFLVFILIWNKKFTLKDIVNVVISHFYKYYLITEKYSDYILFKQTNLFMFDKVHNTLKELH